MRSSRRWHPGSRIWAWSRITWTSPAWKPCRSGWTGSSWRFPAPIRWPLGEARPSEVLDHAFVGLAPGSALQDHVSRHAARTGRSLSYRVRVRTPDAACLMVERGVGVSILPETAARRARRSLAISIVRLNDPWAVRRLTVCARRFSDLPLHARRLVDALRSDSTTPD